MGKIRYFDLLGVGEYNGTWQIAMFFAGKAGSSICDCYKCFYGLTEEEADRYFPGLGVRYVYENLGFYIGVKFEVIEREVMFP